VAAGKKNAARLGAHLVFADESGFLLIPTVRKTWAPRGQTPVCRHPFRREKVSAISAVTVSPRKKRVGLYFCLHETNFRCADVAAFVRHLLRHLRGHVFLLWDNAGIHRGVEVKTLRQRYRRLHVVPLPAYAPELNPDEGVWGYAKRALSNGGRSDTDVLRTEVRRVMRHLRRSPRLIRGFIRHSGLPLFLR
jgi:transposase